jgi:DoxX-like family
MATVTSNERAKEVAAPKSWQLWTGRVLSALPVLLMTMSGAMKLMHAPDFVAMWTGKLGWQEGSLTTIGILELACIAVYLVPRTAFLGALLLTAYLGGAVASHVRIADAFAVPMFLGVLVWAGLYLRDERVRALVLPRG